MCAVLSMRSFSLHIFFSCFAFISPGVPYLHMPLIYLPYKYKFAQTYCFLFMLFEQFVIVCSVVFNFQIDAFFIVVSFLIFHALSLFLFLLFVFYLILFRFLFAWIFAIPRWRYSQICNGTRTNDKLTMNVCVCVRKKKWNLSFSIVWMRKYIRKQAKKWRERETHTEDRGAKWKVSPFQ